ncbi:uncharacterized protein LOC123922992 [Trifolium pratense]|uniref:uncharacterized protein LOC123922992 n=1 Tax=Trifolium pratense TaxID=57577 RepID=UPI001E693857|nr:uncharacterized protein LOC123922992 [Trifolium pratense]
MSESSQTTKTARSTRSKAKIESFLIIKDAVPVTTIHPSNTKSETAAEKKGKMKTAEKKKKTTKVSETISPSVTDKSGKESTRKKKRDYKSRIPLSMSDLVFESNVNTSKRTSETIEGEPQNPKPMSEVVETIIPTTDNPNSTMNLGSTAEKKDLNPKSVETEMEATPTEIETETADKSPTITELVSKKTTHVVTEEDVMPEVETSLNQPEVAETADKETMKEAAVEKDVETTVTASESSDEETGTAQEGVGPVKGWSKVFYPTSKKKETLKRKKESSSDSDYDAAEDVANISSPTPKTKGAAKKVSQSVEEAPCDNISFHRAAFALRWDYIYQRRLAVERELTKDALKCQDILDYIKEAGRSIEPKAELEVANDVVSSEITAGKVKVWPKKKLIPTSKLNVKYAILNRIGSTNWVPTKHATNVATNLGRFIYAVGTKVDYDYGSFIFDQTIKHIGSTAV